MNLRDCYWLTVPNLLTFLRIFLTPFVVYSIISGLWGVASILFFICAISDFLDGFIARTLNQQTFLGACLDPVADKFFVIASFSALALSPFSVVIIPTWFISVMVIKEVLLVLGVFFFYVGVQRQIKVCPSVYGKLAACTQMVSLYAIIIFSYFHIYLSLFGNYFFILLVFIMTVALLDYFFKAVYAYKEEKI